MNIIASALTVGVVGHGLMGGYHVKKLESLPKASIEFVVDADASKLKSVLGKYSTYTSLNEALTSHSPQILAICSNTVAHSEAIQQIFDANRLPAIFCEKSLCLPLL